MLQGCEGGDWLLGAGGAGVWLEAAGDLLLHVLLLVLLRVPAPVTAEAQTPLQGLDVEDRVTENLHLA